MLAYTLERLLSQQAVIERNQATIDAYGADGPDDWQPHLTVPCFLYWDKSAGARSANREYVSPARTVPLSQGGILLALGTDVTENDRVIAVNTRGAQTGAWQTYVSGIFEITAVLAQEDHMELSVVRAHLGA